MGIIRFENAPDQGVCPDGHPCRLGTGPEGDDVRLCGVVTEIKGVSHYIGDPLVDAVIRISKPAFDYADSVYEDDNAGTDDLASALGTVLGHTPS